jgi:hypothetical protein
VRKQAESSLLRKNLREMEVLLDTGRTRKGGMRIILKDRWNSQTPSGYGCIGSVARTEG